MPHRLLADAVLLLHFGFLAFVVCGVLLAWRWPRMAWLHLPALVWGVYVVLAGEICPLTPLENALREAGGVSAYENSFIEHYLLPLIYPGVVQGPTGRALQIGLGLALLLFNAGVYALLWQRRRRRARRLDNRGQSV
jgi:hypothetical protein